MTLVGRRALMKRHCSSIHVPLLASLLCVAVVTTFFASARAQHIDPPYRPDLVGRATEGSVDITIAGKTQVADIKEATFVLRNDISDCDLRKGFNCPVTIELLHILVHSFKFGSIVVPAMEIRNQGPISFESGAFIAHGAPLDIWAQIHALSDHFVVTTFESQSGALVTVAFPPGIQEGIGLFIPMSGTVAGQEVTAEVVIGFQLVNQPPIARAGSSSSSDQTTCTPTIVLDGSLTTDPDGNLSSLRWFDDEGTFVGQGPIIEIPVKTGKFSFGFLLVAEDDIGAVSTARTTITPQRQIVDTTPPRITTVTTNPNTLWPPNHKMVPVSVAVSASDNCDRAPVCKITAVSSNESVDGDRTAPDWEITGNLTVNLRAERSGTGTGRVYTITTQCTDASRNSSTRAIIVTVPHDQGKK
jgi:hypothetical protein